jgi:transcriptional pleiotropic regulator of transition state genes
MSLSILASVSGSGIIRQIDETGRIVIPKEIRTSLGIDDRDELEISVHRDRIVLAKPTDRCVFCADDKHLELFMHQQVCAVCRVELAALAPGASS